ncbi:MAG: DUF3368 domain-containing protein [Lachnospiraceae bacterium]|nr:DUF3368 domain-containing protein [Lachnospiraceae bacterium]
MIIISDTTPLISLLKIGRLELLNYLFGEIQIPYAVYRELTASDKFKQEAIEILQSEYIQKVDVGDKKSVALLMRATGLDEGESEAIILSDEIKADILLMDELKGRQVAKQMGIKIMGTVGILMTAFERKLLSADEIKQCINVMKNNGRHISEQLYEQLLDKIGE